MIRLRDEDIEIVSYDDKVNPEDIVCLANNRKVSINVRDVFPFPYTEEDAKKWIEYASSQPNSTFRILVKNEFAGGIGLMRKTDIHSRTFELGYWLGEPYWGKGIMSRCVKLILPYAFNVLDALRVEALPKTRNAGSRRVLEKNGFVLEGILRSSAVKENVICDMAMYSVIREQVVKRKFSSRKEMTVEIFVAVTVLFVSIGISRYIHRNYSTRGR